MIDPGEAGRSSRRRFLGSGASLFGFGLTLGAMGLLSGCGDGKGTMTMIEKTGDPTKAPGALDSMKAQMDQLKKRRAGTK